MENSWMLVALVWWAWDFHLRLSPIPVRIDVLTQAELPGTRKVPGQPRQRKVLSKYSCPSFTMLSRQATTPQWTRGPWTYRYFNTPVCWAWTHLLPARPCVKEWTRTFYLLLVFGGRFKSDIYRYKRVNFVVCFGLNLLFVCIFCLSWDPSMSKYEAGADIYLSFWYKYSLMKNIK